MKIDCQSPLSSFICVRPSILSESIKICFLLFVKSAYVDCALSLVVYSCLYCSTLFVCGCVCVCGGGGGGGSIVAALAQWILSLNFCHGS